MDPLDDFQIAVAGKLLASADLAVHLSDGGRSRVYDEVPSKRIFPYVVVGNDESRPEHLGCGEAWAIYSKIHIFSRPQPDSNFLGRREVKTIAAIISDELVGPQKGETPLISVNGYSLHTWETRSIRSWLENDESGTIHGLIELRYLLSS